MADPWLVSFGTGTGSTYGPVVIQDASTPEDAATRARPKLETFFAGYPADAKRYSLAFVTRGVEGWTRRLCEDGSWGPYQGS